LYINDSVRISKEKYTVTFTKASQGMLYKGTYGVHYCKIHKVPQNNLRGQQTEP